MSADPKAWILCGIPGSGKTTFARKLAKKNRATYISGDLLRDQLEDSGISNPCWAEIWSEVESAVEEAAGQGHDVVVDGVHSSKACRAETAGLLRGFGYSYLELVVIDCPLERALAQNKQRDRVVDEYIIRNMHRELQKGLNSICSEGWDRVYFVGPGGIM